MNFFYFSLLLTLINVFSSTIDEEKSSVNSPKNGLKNLYQTNNFDLSYHRINWEISPTSRYVKGSVFSLFTYKADNIDRIYFNLSDSLLVDSILYHNESISFLHSNNEIEILVSGNLNQTDSVEIYYQGVPSDEDGGTTFFQGQTTASNPILTTLSEPYGAMLWWPNKQSLNDKIDSLDIFIKTRNQYKAASIGLLASETVDGEFTTYHWKHLYPITPYLIAVAVSNYVTYSDYVELPNGDSLEILNYVYPEKYDDAVLKSPNLIPFFEFCNDTLIPYPFKKEKYGHAQWELNGGMEHQTMTFLNEFSSDLMFHELAHSWFGNYITCGSWQDTWVNEGFATYLTIFGYNDYYYKHALELKKSHVTSDSSGSVFVYDTSDVARVFDRRLTYNKGAMVLHGLRWYLGDSIFFKSLQSFLNDSDLAYRFAKTEDVQHHFELISGLNLQEYFNDWIYGEGYPIYNIEYFQQDTNHVQLKISQTQSHNSVDFFEMYLPIKFYGNNADTLIRLFNSSNNQQYSFNLNFEIDSIKLDPDNWILTKDETIIQTIPKIVSESISIYPNPTSDKLIIDFPDKLKLQSIKIFSYDGKIVSQTIGIENNALDISFLQSGIYFISLEFLKEKRTIKFIKL